MKLLNKVILGKHGVCRVSETLNVEYIYEETSIFDCIIGSACILWLQ